MPHLIIITDNTVQIGCQSYTFEEFYGLNKDYVEAEGLEFDELAYKYIVNLLEKKYGN